MARYRASARSSLRPRLAYAAEAFCRCCDCACCSWILALNQPASPSSLASSSTAAGATEKLFLHWSSSTLEMRSSSLTSSGLARARYGAYAGLHACGDFADVQVLTWRQRDKRCASVGAGSGRCAYTGVTGVRNESSSVVSAVLELAGDGRTCGRRTGGVCCSRGDVLPGELTMVIGAESTGEGRGRESDGEDE